MKHIDEFNRAWGSPHFIKIELDPINVNQVLKAYYTCSPKFSMTKTQLWDLEVKKASQPNLFIPSVIKRGSAIVWGMKKLGNIEVFTRVSEQRLWLDADQYGTVIENVHIDHNAQVVTFIGEIQASSDEKGDFFMNSSQPLFHVQHGVTGSEDMPQNTWKIVHLTSEREDNLNARFERMNNSNGLPEYVEIYLRDVIGLQLDRVH